MLWSQDFSSGREKESHHEACALVPLRVVLDGPLAVEALNVAIIQACCLLIRPSQHQGMSKTRAAKPQRLLQLVSKSTVAQQIRDGLALDSIHDSEAAGGLLGGLRLHVRLGGGSATRQETYIKHLKHKLHMNKARLQNHGEQRINSGCG